MINRRPTLILSRVASATSMQLQFPAHAELADDAAAHLASLMSDGGVDAAGNIVLDGVPMMIDILANDPGSMADFEPPALVSPGGRPMGDSTNSLIVSCDPELMAAFCSATTTAPPILPTSPSLPIPADASLTSMYTTAPPRAAASAPPAAAELNDVPSLESTASALSSPSVCIGAGASGRVRAVFCPALGCHIAVKSIHETTADKRSTGARELAFAQRLLERPDVAPDGLVSVLEVLRDAASGETRVAMEFMPGGTAAELLRPPRAAEPDAAAAAVDDDGHDVESSLAQSVAAAACASAVSASAIDAGREAALRRVAVGALRGLRTLHDGLRVLHRDVTPRNLLVAADGAVKLADFGVVAVLPADGGADAAATDQAGSISYMAPERLRGEPHGPASDVWSVGVVLLELALGGRHPFLPADAGDRFWALTSALRATEGAAACGAATAELVEGALGAVPSGLSGGGFGLLVRRLLRAEASERPTAGQALSEDAWLTAA